MRGDIPLANIAEAVAAGWWVGEHLKSCLRWDFTHLTQLKAQT